MCGIAGVVGGPPVTEALGLEMATRLRHRGPDAQRALALPDGRGVFAHARLQVIDLSERAAQPFVAGDVTLVHNGEIYDFLAHRAELEREGYPLVSRSDTEVVIARYRTGGLDGLNGLDGMFAFALYDAAHQRLVLMRDRVGKKPLYYTRTPSGALVFGSEIKALLLHPEVDAELDPSALPDFLTFGYVGTPRSLYRGVSKLPPGHRLVVEGDGEPRVEAYDRLEDRLAPIRMSDGGAKAAVREAVGRAVERRLVADVPLGAFLSGGIDSSVVVAEMATRSPSRVRTFAVGFDDDASFDETAHARDVAARFDTDHTEIRLEALPTDLFEALLDHHDEPYGDSSALAVHAVSKATRAHVTVVLTGDGGDEAFGGYTRFLGGLIDAKVPGSAKRALSSVLERLPEPPGYKNPISLARRFVEHARRSPDEQLLAWNSFFAGPRLAALLRPEVAGPGFDPWAPMRPQVTLLEAARAAGHDRLGQILLHNLRTYLLDDLLVKVDRMTMAVGLEARSPFLDTELLRLALSLPSDLKIRRGQLKWVLREAYREVLPASVLDRQKHGFGVPVAAWWRGPLRDMVRDLLVAPSARVHALLEPAELAELVAEHQAGRRDHGQRLFALVQLELWLRRLGAG